MDCSQIGAIEVVVRQGWSWAAVCGAGGAQRGKEASGMHGGHIHWLLFTANNTGAKSVDESSTLVLSGSGEVRVCRHREAAGTLNIICSRGLSI